jgi:hypothetical protein
LIAAHSPVLTVALLLLPSAETDRAAALRAEVRLVDEEIVRMEKELAAIDGAKRRQQQYNTVPLQHQSRRAETSSPLTWPSIASSGARPA